MQRRVAGTVGLHAMTLTTGVMKECAFHSAPGLDIAVVRASMGDEVPTHDAECVAAEEPDWESFRSFVR